MRHSDFDWKFDIRFPIKVYRPAQINLFDSVSKTLGGHPFMIVSNQVFPQKLDFQNSTLLFQFY